MKSIKIFSQTQHHRFRAENRCMENACFAVVYTKIVARISSRPCLLQSPKHYAKPWKGMWLRQGRQPFRQVGHIERYNLLEGTEHSNISTVTNTKLNATIKTAETYLSFFLWNLGLHLLSKRINFRFHIFKYQFASHHVRPHRWFLNETSISFVSYVKKNVHIHYLCYQIHTFVLTQRIEILVATEARKVIKASWLKLLCKIESYWKLNQFNLQFFWSITDFNGEWVFKDT
jgi:hypothetical protein